MEKSPNLGENKSSMLNDDEVENMKSFQPSASTNIIERDPDSSLNDNPTVQLRQIAQENSWDDEEEDQNVYTYSSRRGFGFKTWVRIFLLIFLLFFSYILITNPDAIFHRLKNFFNKDYGSHPVVYESSDFNTAEMFDYPNSQMRMDEAELYFLLNLNSEQNRVDRVEVHKNKIILFRNLSKDEVPLWLAMEIVEKDNKYEIEKVGFGRVAAPDFLVENVLQKSFDLVQDTTADKDGLLANLLSKTVGDTVGSALNPTNVDFEEGEMVINISRAEPMLDIKVDFKELEEDIFKKFQDTVSNP